MHRNAVCYLQRDLTEENKEQNKQEEEEEGKKEEKEEKDEGHIFIFLSVKTSAVKPTCSLCHPSASGAVKVQQHATHNYHDHQEEGQTGILSEMMSPLLG